MQRKRSLVDQPVQKQDKLRQDRHHQQHGNRRTTPDGQTDVADIHVTDTEADHEAGHRQDRPGRDYRREALVHSGDHRLTLSLLLLQRLIAVHDHDRVVDGRAHLDRRHNHVRDKRSNQSLEVRESKVDPDASLNDEGKQRGSDGCAEGEQQDHEDKCNRQQSDLFGITRVGVLQVLRAGNLTDDQHIAFSVILLRFLPDRFRQSQALFTLHRHICAENQTVVILPAKLHGAPVQLGAQILDRGHLLFVQIDHALIDLLKQVLKHIKQDHPVFVRVAEEYLVFLILDAVAFIQKQRGLIVNVQKFSEFLRREGIRQDMPVSNLDVRKAGRAPDFVHPGYRVQDRLLTLVRT